ncbi:hypothetical protein BO71DRAFT_67519 [Aspergillus ellipticus CBS 707.79]|uniref:Uncharacterized protein n=1 Tax=Aspergillus ellipticus CBS 707.79 TaxID=1448320 RepID=A0A319D1A2_9EURO|nr:hypothetical protein BO71DRAFT_67519 [Aspergillus ellipticus CBS 707.79]
MFFGNHGEDGDRMGWYGGCSACVRACVRALGCWVGIVRYRMLILLLFSTVLMYQSRTCVFLGKYLSTYLGRKVSVRVLYISSLLW